MENINGNENLIDENNTEIINNIEIENLPINNNDNNLNGHGQEEIVNNPIFPIIEPNLNNNNIDDNNSIFTSPISTLEEIHRATNEEILNLFRQAITLRERTSNTTNFRSELLEFEENLYEHLISNKILLFTPFILVLIVGCLGIELSSLTKSGKFTFKTLETEVMWVPYSLILLLMIILTWNVYLFVLKIFTGFSEKPAIRIKIKNLFELGIADMLYFNPFYFNILVFHFDKTYLATNFDLFTNMFFATKLMINFFFSNFIFNYFKITISNITNLHLGENKYLIYKMRFLFFFLISFNVLTSYCITYVTTESDFYYIYLMQHKCLYLILKQVGMWYENESSYKQLDSFYATNEQYYLKSIFTKMIIQLVVMILIIQILFFGNMLFCKRGAYFFFVPCTFICVKTMIDFFKVFKNYEEIKVFFDKLDSV